MSRERITIAVSFEEMSDLQRRAGRLTQAEKSRCNVSDLVRNALAFYCSGQDKCLACTSDAACQIHGTKILRPRQVAEKASAEDIRRVTDHYFAEFIEAKKARPHFGGAEGKAIRELILRMGADEAVGTISRAFADPFWRSRATILSIAADPSRHMGDVAKRATKSSLQADSGYHGGEEKR